MSIMEQAWHTGAGQARQVNLIESVREIVSVPPVDKRIIMIGTDGQRRKKKPGVDFVTVVAIHNKGKGGLGYWSRTRFRRRFSLQQKLMQETMQSLEVAFALMDVIPEEDHELEIHVDANPHDRWASSQYHKQLAGMVTGQGFKAVLKPHAWVASHAADHFVKNKHVGR